MLVAAIVFFLLAAVAGFFILAAILKNKPTPKPAVIIHGGVVLIALLIMVTYIAMGHTAMLLVTSFGLFVLAALGGLTMLTFDVSDKPIPKLIAVFHPILAIIALGLLIAYVLQS